MAKPYVFRRPFEKELFSPIPHRRRLQRTSFVVSAATSMGVTAGETNVAKATERPASSLGALGGETASAKATERPAATLAETSGATTSATMARIAAATVAAKAGETGVGNLSGANAVSFGAVVAVSSIGRGVMRVASSFGMRGSIAVSSAVHFVASQSLGAVVGLTGRGGFAYFMSATLGVKAGETGTGKRATSAAVTFATTEGLSAVGRRSTSVSVTFGVRTSEIESDHTIEVAVASFPMGAGAGFFARRTEKAAASVGAKAGFGGSGAITARVAAALGARVAETSTSVVTERPIGTVGVRVAQIVGSAPMVARPKATLAIMPTFFDGLTSLTAHAPALLAARMTLAGTPKTSGHALTMLQIVAALTSSVRATERPQVLIAALPGIAPHDKSTLRAAVTLGARTRAQQPVGVSAIFAAIAGLSASARVTRRASATLATRESQSSVIRGAIHPQVLLSSRAGIPTATVSVLYHTEALPNYTLTNVRVRARVLANDTTRFVKTV